MSSVSTKNKILQAAVKLLETSGIKGLTQPAVAKLVGIPQGQLTYHFRHRSDLILAVTEAATDAVAEYLWKNHPTLASQSFSRLIGLVMEQMKSKTRIRAILGLLIEADEDPEISKAVLEQARKVRSLIAAALQLEDEAAEVTMSHAMMLGFALMFFAETRKENRKMIEEHFHSAVEVLEKHLKEKKAKRK